MNQPHSSAIKIKIAMVGYEDYLAPDCSRTGDFGNNHAERIFRNARRVVVKAKSAGKRASKETQ